MAPEHTTPQDAITSWFANLTQLGGRDAQDLIAHLYEAGWTFRRTEEIAIDRGDAERVSQQSENAAQSRIRAALERQEAEPAPLTAEEAIENAHAHWLSPHVHRGVPARLATASGERDIIVRLDTENRAELVPAITESDEQGPQSYCLRFPVNVNTDSDILGAIKILGSKLEDAGHRYELVNEPAS